MRLSSRGLATLALEHYIVYLFFVYSSYSTGCLLTFILSMQRIAFFKELELVGKFFKRATTNWKTLSDHALQAHVHSRLRLLHVDNFKIILSLQKQLNLKKNNKC